MKERRREERRAGSHRRAVDRRAVRRERLWVALVVAIFAIGWFSLQAQTNKLDANTVTDDQQQKVELNQCLRVQDDRDDINRAQAIEFLILSQIITNVEKQGRADDAKDYVPMRDATRYKPPTDCDKATTDIHYKRPAAQPWTVEIAQRVLVATG